MSSVPINKRKKAATRTKRSERSGNPDDIRNTGVTVVVPAVPSGDDAPIKYLRYLKGGIKLLSHAVEDSGTVKMTFKPNDEKITATCRKKKSYGVLLKINATTPDGESSANPIGVISRAYTYGDTPHIIDDPIVDDGRQIDALAALSAGVVLPFATARKKREAPRDDH